MLNEIETDQLYDMIEAHGLAEVVNGLVSSAQENFRLSVNAELLAVLKKVLPSLDSLVAQECLDPDVAAYDIAMRDLVRAAIAKAEGTPC